MKKKKPNKNTIIVILIIMLLHLILINHYFPLKLLLDNRPIITDDYPFKLTLAMHNKASLMDFTPHIRGYELLFSVISIILYFSPIIYLFKVQVLLFIFLIPLIFFLIGKNFGLTKQQSLLLMILSIIVINFDYQIHKLIHAGLYSFFFSIALAFLIISYYHKCL